MAGGGHAMRGVVLGRQIDLRPSPPEQDTLAEPLALERTPAYQPPEDGRWARLHALLARLGWTVGSTDRREVTRVHTVTARTLSAVSPPIARQLRSSGWLRRHGVVGRSSVPAVTHPYTLLEAFQLLFRIPPEMSKEQRFLELVLALTLRQYAQLLSRQTGTRFGFDLEAMEYMVQATKIERVLKKATNPSERMDLVQAMYNAFYHARHYYMFSLIARERSANQGKMFPLYCHAAHTMARIHWDGAISETAIGARLPSRREVLFLFKRDRALIQRCADDETYAAQVKAMVASFPR